MLPFWTNSNFTHVFSHSCFSTSVVCDLPGFKVITAVLTHTTVAMTVLHADFAGCLLIDGPACSCFSASQMFCHFQELNPGKFG